MGPLIPSGQSRSCTAPSEIVRFTVNLVDLKRAFRRMLARLPDEAEAGTDCVAFNARGTVLEILAGDTSEFTQANIVQPGQGRVSLSVFRRIARTLQFFRRRLIAVTFSSRMLQVERTQFRHPEISVQTSTEDL